LNWIDLVILLMFAWFTYAAFHAGLIREVVTILGAILAVVLAGLFYTDLATDIQVAVDDENTARVIAFGVIFGATVLASQLLALVLKQAASLLMLGIFDSLAGAVMGLIKAFIFVQIGLFVAITFPNLGLERHVAGSALAPFFINVLPLLQALLPGEFRNAIEAF
jgi:membrane protein required for colicin V production